MRTITTITMFLLMLVSTTAQAQLFELPAGDLSVKVLNYLFGGLIGDFGGQDPLLNAIKIFNSGILIVGGILAAYTILAGTIGTAHDGEMLGKKFSSVWIPIRYSFGTALILPVIGGGYAVIQAVVMWLILSGIGLADSVYVSYMSNPITNSNIKISTYGDSGTLALAENIFAMNVCVEAHNKVQDDKWLTFFGKTIYTASRDGNKINFGSNKTDASFGECGTITLPESKNIEVAAPNQQNYQGMLGSIGQLYQSIDFTTITDEHIEQTMLLNKNLQALAKSSVDNRKELNAPAVYKEIENFANQYKQAVEGKGQQFTESVNLTETAIKNGWLVAGFNFVNDITVNNNLTSSIQSVSTANANMYYTKSGSYEKHAQEYLSVIPAVLSRSKTPQVSRMNSENYSEQETGTSLSGRIGASIAEAFTTINLYELQNDSRHPLIVLNEMGQRILSANLTMIFSISGIALIAGTGALVAGSGVVAAANIITSFLALPIAGLWTIGIIASYVIPFIPAFIWIGSIIGFFLLVVEAIIAAPLWIVMHLHPNGDDLTGKGQAGYSLVLSLLLRPTLMVFGFIFAVIISGVIGELINKVFFQIFAMNNGGNIQGISSMLVILGGTAIYGTLMFTLMRKTFSLVNLLPDQLLRWISGPTEQMGAFAGEFDSATTTATKGATAGVLGASTAVAHGFGKLGATTAMKAEQQAPSDALHSMRDILNSQPPQTDNGDQGSTTPPTSPIGFSAQAQAHPTEQENSGPMSTPTSTTDDGTQAPQTTPNPMGFTAQEQAQAQGKVRAVEGTVVSYGTAPYKDNPLNKQSFYVETQASNGETTKTWGKGLEPLIAQNNIDKGDFVKFKMDGSNMVETTNNQGEQITAEKNNWSLEQLNDQSFRTEEEVQPNQENGNEDKNPPKPI